MSFSFINNESKELWNNDLAYFNFFFLQKVDFFTLELLK